MPLPVGGVDVQRGNPFAISPRSERLRYSLVASGEKYTICLVSRLEWRDLVLMRAAPRMGRLVPLAELISIVAGSFPEVEASEQ